MKTYILNIKKPCMTFEVRVILWREKNIFIMLAFIKRVDKIRFKTKICRRKSRFSNKKVILCDL